MTALWRSLWYRIRRVAAGTVVVMVVLLVVAPVPLQARPAEDAGFTVSRAADPNDEYTSGGEGTYFSSTSALSTTGGSTWDEGPSLTSSSAENETSSSGSKDQRGWLGAVWGKVKSAVSNTVSTVKNVVAEGIENARQGVETLMADIHVVEKAGVERVGQFVSDAFEDIRTGVTRVVDAGETAIGVMEVGAGFVAEQAVGFVRDKVAEIQQEVHTAVDLGQKAVEAIQTDAKVVAAAAVEYANNKVSEIRQGVKTAIDLGKKAVDSVVAGAKYASDVVEAGTAKVAEWAKPAGKWLANTVTDVLTGATIDEWKNCGDWDWKKWTWVGGSCLLTLGSFVFPPLAAGKFGKGGQVVATALKAPIVNAGKWASEALGGLAKAAPAVVETVAKTPLVRWAKNTVVGQAVTKKGEELASTKLYKATAQYVTDVATTVGGWVKEVKPSKLKDLLKLDPRNPLIGKAKPLLDWGVKKLEPYVPNSVKIVASKVAATANSAVKSVTESRLVRAAVESKPVQAVAKLAEKTGVGKWDIVDAVRQKSAKPFAGVPTKLAKNLGEESSSQSMQAVARALNAGKERNAVKDLVTKVEAVVSKPSSTTTTTKPSSAPAISPTRPATPAVKPPTPVVKPPTPVVKPPTPVVKPPTPASPARPAVPKTKNRAV